MTQSHDLDFDHALNILPHESVQSLTTERLREMEVQSTRGYLNWTSSHGPRTTRSVSFDVREIDQRIDLSETLHSDTTLVTPLHLLQWYHILSLCESAHHATTQCESTDATECASRAIVRERINGSNRLELERRRPASPFRDRPKTAFPTRTGTDAHVSAIPRPISNKPFADSSV